MPAEQQVEIRMHERAWQTFAVGVGVFIALDFVLATLVAEIAARMAIRWTVVGVSSALVTLVLNRRTIRMVSDLMRGERVARNEAEAFANLAAVVAAGNNIEDALFAAVRATASLLGRGARATIAVPDQDGLLKVLAWSHQSGEVISRFRFRPGEDYVGRAFSERRTVAVADLVNNSDRPDMKRVSDVKSLVAAPLVAGGRTLGVISVVWPTVNAFSKHDERVVNSIARHVAVALAATEARESARGEAAEKAAIIEQMADAVIVADRNLVIREANVAAARLFDLDESDLIGRTRASLPGEMLETDGSPVAECSGPLARACAGDLVASEYRLVTHAGNERWVSATASPLRDAEGAVTGGILVLRDMAPWRAAQAALTESEERYRRLVELCPDPIVVTCDANIVYANAAAADLAGAGRAQDLFGRSMFEFIPEADRAQVRELSRDLTEFGGEPSTNEREVVRIDGERITIEATSMPITYQGRPAIQAVLRDVTERKRAEAALAYQATHDALTGLPNRVLLLDRLEQALAIAKREGGPVSLLIMDLDRFKEVNDTLGHHAGDLLLQQVGMRLRGALRQSDTIARLGGDEFAIIVPGTSATSVVGVVENLLGRLHSPLTIEQQPVVVAASIGVVVSPDHGNDAESLMRRADVAMYVAKRNGSGVAVYRPEHDRNSPNRLSLIGELRRAIDAGELILHYQPKLHLGSKTVSGVEALVRWVHPTRGVIPPDQFIPLAEQAGLIEPLTRWVLRSALIQANRWRHMGHHVPVAVNLSMRSLHDDALPNMLADLLDTTHTCPELLMVEITESSFMIDPPQTQAILKRLRDMGIRVAIDDFGTGHSSLAYLKRLPVDQIKIDRSFVKDMVADDTDRVIVRTTIEMAHSLGLTVVAEGVEDELTQRLLASLGCDEAQGFHLTRPLPGHELGLWLESMPRAA